MLLRLFATLAVSAFTIQPLLAKDLPVRRAEPPRKATGCEFLGTDYEKLPGTDTCVKVGGRVRAEGSFIKR